MKIFSRLYAWMLGLARHEHAPYYLSAISVAESSFFPIPPDVMLAPMALAQPKRAWFYAALTTVSSVFGGALGYLIGYIAYSTVIEGLLIKFNYIGYYHMAETWFNAWGVWVILFAGFTFIPYKIFTIASGALHMAFSLLFWLLSSPVALATLLLRD